MWEKKKEKKTGKPSGFIPSKDSESAAPAIGPHNPALGEIYQRLYPEMRRPKPNQEAIAAALQAMQRLTMDADSESVVEEAVPETAVDPQNACRVCGHPNRAGNRFCGACALALGTDPVQPTTHALSTLDSSTVGNHEEPLPQTPPPALEAADEVHPAAD